MARSRGFMRGRTHGSNRRKTGWNEGPFSTVTLLNAEGSTLWSTGQNFLADGLTIARIRGEVLLFLGAVTSALDGFQSYALGLGIVSTAAFTAGVASVPSPLTEIDWEGWLWHHSGAAIQQKAGAEDITDPSNSVRIAIDTKAMRKVDSDETLIGVVELGTEIGTASLQFSARTRMLVMLP